MLPTSPGGSAEEMCEVVLPPEGDALVQSPPQTAGSLVLPVVGEAEGEDDTAYIFVVGAGKQVDTRPVVDSGAIVS